MLYNICYYKRINLSNLETSGFCNDYHSKDNDGQKESQVSSKLTIIQNQNQGEQKPRTIIKTFQHSMSQDKIAKANFTANKNTLSMYSSSISSSA